MAEWQAWLVAILRNEIRNLLRYWHQECRDVDREQRAPAQSSGGFVLTRDNSTPSIRASRREQAFQLMAAIKRLKPHYRQIIELRHFNALPYKEIAVRMDRTEDSARQLWFRALGQLREEMGEVT